MRRSIALAMLVGACGCAAAPAVGRGDAGCDATKAQPLVGQAASSSVAAQAQRLSGATVVRWLQPGQIVTMEYRADRLNLVLDSQNRVQAIRCG